MKKKNLTKTIKSTHDCQACYFPCDCGRPDKYTCKGCKVCNDLTRKDPEKYSVTSGAFVIG